MTDLLFKDIIDWLKKDLRQDSWLTIYKSFRLHTEWFEIFPVMFPKNLTTEFLKHGAWSLNITNFQPGHVHYSDQESKYFRWGFDAKYEPLVYQCFYNNIYPTTVEIIEEFKLYFNLYHDKKSNKYIAVNDMSDETVVVTQTDEEIKIKTTHLREFLAAKKMKLGLQLDFYRFSNLSLNKHGLSEGDYFQDKGKDYCYDITFQKSDYFNDTSRKVNSRLLGKKIVDNLSQFKPKPWHEQFVNTKFVDFIINMDTETGNEIEHSCNPELLSDYFGKNPEAPNYLTPVFFKREVLVKYYQDTKKYSVYDGGIECKGSWRLDIDNNLEDSIIAYLGDLGRDIPFSEQSYWRGFNIPPNGKMSMVKFKRDFLTVATNPENIDLIFKNKFEKLKIDWNRKFGFSLYKELTGEDSHCLKAIRLPLFENNAEFDNLVLNLTKTLIDYLNEGEIGKRIKTDEKNLQGIGKLEILLGKANPQPKHVIPFLRQLQRLRSKGAAHQKGSDYKKVLKEMEIDDKTFYKAYESILNKSIIMIDELNEIIKNPAPNNL